MRVFREALGHLPSGVDKVMLRSDTAGYQQELLRPGDELVRWSRQRCGKGEEIHGVLKNDLAGGRMPSGLFGANAAWWAIAVLAFNLNSAMRWLVLGAQWVSKRLKAVRFALIALPGRVVWHARRLIVRLARGHPSYELLLRARQRILALAA